MVTVTKIGRRFWGISWQSRSMSSPRFSVHVFFCALHYTFYNVHSTIVLCGTSHAIVSKLADRWVVHNFLVHLLCITIHSYRINVQLCCGWLLSPLCCGPQVDWENKLTYKIAKAWLRVHGEHCTFKFAHKVEVNKCVVALCNPQFYQNMWQLTP